MQITGIWHPYVQPPFGQDPDWSGPTIEFRDGRILLGDGSELAFTNKRGVLRFSYPVTDGAADCCVANVLIDRGSDGLLQGWRFLSAAAVPDFPDPEDQLPDGDRLARLRLIREDRFAAFKAEQEGFAVAQKRVLAEREEDVSAAPMTVH